MKQLDTNPVKKNMDKLHKPVTHTDRKKENKNGYKKHKTSYKNLKEIIYLC